MDRREFLSGAALLTAAVAGCSRSTAEQSTPGATDTMTFEVQNGQGAQPLDIETILNWIRGDAVVSGCTPSDGVNAMEVDIASGTVRVDGSNVSVSAQTVTLLTGGTDPRKDLIWVDSTGTVQVSQGIEAPYLPSGKTGFNTHQPSPPDSTGVNGAVVAEVVVDAGASDIDGTPGQDLRDRRILNANLVADSVETDEMSVGERFNLDYSDNYPFSPRAPEQSGPPQFRPHARAANPVVTASDVSDVAANFVADPFVVYDESDGEFHLFFEIHDGTTGTIGHAASLDGISWTYNQEVLDVTEFTAYPQVLKENGTWYLIPSFANSDQKWSIFEATSFPTSWSRAETPQTGSAFIDPTVFKFGGRWWMYCMNNDSATEEVRLYYSDSETLTGGSWTQHPSSPIASGSSHDQFRPAGRPIVREGSVDTFWQDTSGAVRKVSGYRFDTLTTSSFSQSKIGTMISGEQSGDWKDQEMHHIDPMLKSVGGASIAAVDGKGAGGNWSIGIYTETEEPYTVGIATLSGVNSIPSGASWTALTFDSILHDTDSAFSGGDYVAPADGVYEIAAHARSGTPGTSGFVWQLRLASGSKEIGLEHGHAAVADNVAASWSGTVELSEGETLTAYAQQDSGSSLDALSGRNNTVLTVRRVV